MKKLWYAIFMHLALLCVNSNALEAFDDCLCLENISHALQAYSHVTTATQFFFDINHTGNTYAPNNIAELQDLLKNAVIHHKKISMVGEGKSQGGQTISNAQDSYRISLHNMNKLLFLDTKKKTATVEAGMTWKQLQEYLAPHGLSIKAMQSYNDFSIGGSVSVNVHGQDPSVGQLISTILSMQVLMPSGKIITVSRQKNKQLFSAIIGGYGLIGIILSVTLQLTDDTLLERNAIIIPSTSLVEYLNKNVISNQNIALYSARFSVGASDFMEKAIVVTYRKLANQNSVVHPLLPTQQSNLVRWGLKLTGLIPYTKNIRLYFEQFMHKHPHITSRNNFLNYSILELPQNTSSTEYILQEYFLPYDKVDHFIQDFSRLTKEYAINVLNVTARHVCQDTQSLLSFAPREDMCALVIYLKVARTTLDRQRVINWTRNLIDAAIKYQGTYYLPYHLLATRDQFISVYPKWDDFISIKNRYDPQNILSNKLYEYYLIS